MLETIQAAIKGRAVAIGIGGPMGVDLINIADQALDRFAVTDGRPIAAGGAEEVAIVRWNATTNDGARLGLEKRVKNGIVVLSGCSASPLYHRTDADAMIFAGSLFDILGADNFYAEVMGVIAEDNFSRPQMIAKRLGLKMVLTNDTHFTRKQDANAHTIMCISRKGFDYTSGELYLNTREEMLGTKFLKAYAGSTLLEELLDNTNTLSDEFEEIDLSGEPKLPRASSEVNILQMAIEKRLVIALLEIIALNMRLM